MKVLVLSRVDIPILWVKIMSICCTGSPFPYYRVCSCQGGLSQSQVQSMARLLCHSSVQYLCPLYVVLQSTHCLVYSYLDIRVQAILWCYIKNVTRFFLIANVIQKFLTSKVC